MANDIKFLVMTFFLVAWLASLGQCASANGKNKYVRDACRVTRYPDLCIHSLAPFSNTAKTSPTLWARAGVSVTLSEAKSVARYLVRLKSQRSSFRGRNSAALSDCIECFENVIDELHKSLRVLRSLSRGTFSTQMADLNTWLSAALTDEDTCLDGFAGQKGKLIKFLLNRVSKASYITSNALALANKLAATGLGSVIDP
ncbi:pectinesterase inhibitor 6 [Ziziphus jujuba]|uniref:Pectinesterase inhibitor 6 n=2 Tax=Ziziphus jujuba TaxID=326968 RepID=A0A6P4AS12_ZIZJJ|nr:pectinesterase inhibitor 6 [Ziziphus jujuba]KAH7517061.1 hypothetical protein FEM48_Zijuj09G0022200 [Ziziphus jujuba var. spinosa]